MKNEQESINGYFNELKIATLGPEGTCSERAAIYYANKNNVKYKTILCDTFETAIKKLMFEIVDIVIIPSAYRELAEIVFENMDDIELSDIFLYSTPGLVIATGYEDVSIDEIKTMATHSSPSILAQKSCPNAKLTYCSSNSASALKVVNGDVDACVTTRICVEMNNLHIVKDFGEVQMGWNVFKKNNNNRKRIKNANN